MDDDLETGLVEHVRGGDAGALERLLERWGDRVHRVAFAVTRDARESEEVAHVVFLRLIRGRQRFERPSALATWIYRETVRAALARPRAARSDAEPSLERDLPVFAPDGRRAGDPAVLLSDWSERPDDELAAESRVVVERALESLPAHDRAILILCDVERLPSTDVAEVMGETVAGVKSRAHRARMALREQLTRHLTPPRRP